MFPCNSGRSFAFCSAVVFVIALSSCCFAQTSRIFGAVQGSVFDQSGGAVMGAKVTLRNQGTGQIRATSAGPQGWFRVSELPSDQYELRVESPGFSSYPNQAIVVSIGRVVQITVRLTPATVRQEVTVSEEPPPIDPTQTTVATTIGTERIEESPVVSRNYLDFVLLAPQLSASNTQGNSSNKSAIVDSGFTFAGLRSRSNSLDIDGVENNDEFTGSARTELSPETVHEFQVVNNGLSAESAEFALRNRRGVSGPASNQNSSPNESVQDRFRSTGFGH